MSAATGFRLGCVDGRAVLVVDGRVHDVVAASGGRLSPDPMALLADPDALRALSAAIDPAASGVAVDDASFGCPVPSPSQVFAIGLNYGAHAAESGLAAPASPVVFTKFASSLAGDGAEIPVPGDTIDFEAEVVVVIGRGGRDIPAVAAWDHVAGVTAGQDVSDRTLQFAASPAHFALAKSRAGYSPIGPVVVDVAAFDDPDDIGLVCRVDGEVRQDARTRDLLVDVPALLAHLSSIVELRPGDLLFTGTPGGVGMADGRYLRPGQVVETEVEGVGVLTNRCVAVGPDRG